MSKKVSTKQTSKVVGGNLNKKSLVSHKKRTLLIGLVGVLVFIVLVGFGWQKLQEKQLKAQAAGWTRVGPGWGSKVTIRACKGYYSTSTRQRTYKVLITSELNKSMSYYGSVSGFVAPYGTSLKSFTGSTTGGSVGLNDGSMAYWPVSDATVQAYC